MNHRQAVVAIACLLAATAFGSTGVRAADDPAAAVNKRLGRGVNIGNALEAPNEGDWGVTLEASYFRRIKAAGFDSVRLPINWANHALRTAPYTIDAPFAARVDWAIDQALSRKLAIVINIHHYEEMFNAPDEHLERCLALWKQIAERYQHQPGEVLFELLNEPHGKLDDDRWNAMIPRFLAVIRPTNPRRAVLIGPTQWNSIEKLDKLRLPKSDRALIATVHYYLPFQFTHQGAPWIDGSGRWKGTAWTGSPAEQKALRDDFQTAARWGREHERPIYLGEFGAYNGAPMDSRIRWTGAVAEEARKLGMSCSYWEFTSNFGAFDPQTHSWRAGLLDALLGSEQ